MITDVQDDMFQVQKMTRCDWCMAADNSLCTNTQPVLNVSLARVPTTTTTTSNNNPKVSTSTEIVQYKYSTGSESQYYGHYILVLDSLLHVIVF